MTGFGDQSIDQRAARRSLRRAGGPSGMTILELLIVIGIIGVLAGILLPAVSAAREAARRVQCVNQLKQIGLALHGYHDLNNCLPQGWQLEQSLHSGYGWCVTLLPFLDQQSVYERVDRNRILADPVNSDARQTWLTALVCPSDMVDPTFTLYSEPVPQSLASTVISSYPSQTGDGGIPGAAVRLVDLPTTSYVGVFGTTEADDEFPAPAGDGAILCDRPVRFDELSRGLSQTLIAGERMMAVVPSTWLGVDVAGEDAACRLVGSAITAPNCRECDECEFSSRHSGGANFLYGDGTVRMVSELIDREQYRRLARRSDF